MSQEQDIIRCHVRAPDTQALRDFLDDTQPDVGCRAVARHTQAGVALDLYFRQEQLDEARAARSAPLVDITVIENVTENWRSLTEEIGGGDRFAQRDAVPHGLGRKE